MDIEWVNFGDMNC